jgi:hypothetical protein
VTLAESNWQGLILGVNTGDNCGGGLVLRPRADEKTVSLFVVQALLALA